MNKDAGIGKPIPSAEITPEKVYLRRRDFLRSSVLFTAASGGLGGTLLWLINGLRGQDPAQPPPVVSTAPSAAAVTSAATAGTELVITKRVEDAGGEPATSYQDISTYNNFYEFGTDKGDPAANARTLRPRPWTIALEGEVMRPRVYEIDQLIGSMSLQERVYRMRCVEAWSMVIPWVGFPLGDLLRQAGLTSRAKYVAFSTLLDPKQMPGQRDDVLPWPYVEGLRIDEAMHPLTLLAVGLYGRVLPNQDGAPIRLVTPWKYGFKGIKSIVKIKLVEQMPPTTWNIAAPNEYGFYANVNPAVDHPRWSQATERRIGDFSRRPTLPFNGYSGQVAGLYSGMDLRKFF